MMNKKFKYLLQLLGPAILVYILFQIDFGLLRKELLNLNIYLLLLAVLFMVVQVIIRAEKWRIILTALAIKLTVAKAISLYWLGTFIGVITPGRLGELAKVYFLKNRGESGFRSFLSVLLDRLTDVALLLLLGLLIFLFFLREIGTYIIFVGIASVLFSLFIFLLIDRRSFLHKLFPKIIKKIFPVDFEEYNWQDIKGFKKNQLVPFFVCLIVSWLFYFFSRYLAALALGFELSFLEISVISVLITLVTMLPISVAGIGTREAAVIYLFGLFAISKEPALLYSLVIFTVDLLTISFGLIPYLKESSLINKIKQT